MQVETFKVFCDLCETESFTEAAKRNGVTQSAISQQIAGLERNLHTLLVNRAGAGLSAACTLTPAGQICLEHGREIVRLAVELGEAMQKSKEAHPEGVRLAVSHSIALHQLPSILQRFQAENPAAVMHVRHGSVVRVFEEVLAREADIGLVGFPRWHKIELKTETFRIERLVLVCHPQHPLATRAEVSFVKLKGERFVAWQEIPWSLFMGTISAGMRHHFSPVQEFEELEAVKQAVEADTGISILPEATVRSEVANRTLAAVPFEGDGYLQPLTVIYRNRGKIPPNVEKFIQFLKQPDGMDSGFEI